MHISQVDTIMKHSGASLDFILALEEYLQKHNTSLQEFMEWKNYEDMYSLQPDQEEHWASSTTVKKL